MKEFCKWLGVDEKIARVVVWIAIFMMMLVLTNVMLESVGLPFYKLTAENLSKVNCGKVVNFCLACTITILNFYTFVFLVFRIKEFKKIFSYSILYIVLNAIINYTYGKGILEIFIILFIIIFCYFYSNKNKKYILYGIGSIVINTIVQFICYLYKLRFIDYDSLNYYSRILISCDYFLIMFILILVKEIYIKNKKEKEVLKNA